ncbi:hypothetical protein HRI_000832800 [Hibiscus trionum]|uniref:Uncharacterized protein n=1 Tax=Hibiscus trionum TaxID=183268 RepID=A0A9W7H976_HIBTR|nr:hypothetical protein HRI_000832800 [Hibiscus trionum]
MYEPDLTIGSGWIRSGSRHSNLKAKRLSILPPEDTHTQTQTQTRIQNSVSRWTKRKATNPSEFAESDLPKQAIAEASSSSGFSTLIDYRRMTSAWTNRSFAMIHRGIGKELENLSGVLGFYLFCFNEMEIVAPLRSSGEMLVGG